MFALTVTKPRVPLTLDRLTPAERNVVDLLLTGASNKAIASRRGTSPRTVANQLQAIYDKLGVPSRRALIAKFAPNGQPLLRVVAPAMSE